MPSSSRNVNIQHGSNAHRRRIRHQTAGSISTEKRSETERRGSKSEDTKMTNGTSAGNRFAALAHTEPAPGVNVECGLETKQTDFTFRCARPFSTAAGTTVASEVRQLLDTQAKGQVLRLSPVATPSTRKQSDPVLTPSLLAELRVAALLQGSEDLQAPPTPPHTPPWEASPLFAHSSIHNSHPAVATESLSHKSIDVPSTSLLRARQPQTGALPNVLPSSSPPSTDLPVRSPRKLRMPKPKVHLPPTLAMTPSHQTTTPRVFFPDSDPFAHTLTSAESRNFAMAAEIAPATSLEATSKPAERVESKRAEASRVHSSKGSEESSVDEVSEGGSDGEWELVG